MANSNAIDSLIETYRQLNHAIRPMTDDQLSAVGPDGSVIDVLRAMRRREILSSQQLKMMMVADAAGTGADSVDESLVDTGESLPGKVILSEFGTARESILAAAIQRSPEELARELPTPNGQKSIKSLLDSLVEADAVDLAKIERLRAGS